VARPAHPAVAQALATVRAQQFLGWARFPVFIVDSGSSGYVVHIMDLRYTTNPDARFGALAVAVAR
jgi:hypothetical protein